MILKRPLILKDSFFRREGREGKRGGVVCECFECCSRAGTNSGLATKIVA
jgi:hypothetical protein